MAKGRFSNGEPNIKSIIVEKGNSINLSSFKDEAIEVPLTIEFSHFINDTVGIAKVYKDNGILKADMIIAESKNDVIPLFFYPAIAGVVNKREGKIITDFRLTSVSLCSNPNEDKTIFNLLKQLQIQKAPEEIKQEVKEEIKTIDEEPKSDIKPELVKRKLKKTKK